MRTLFNTSHNEALVHIWLFIYRILIGALMLTHGYPKLLRLIGPGEITFGDPLGVGTVPSLTLAVFAEFFCSILLILGLATRLATIPLIVTMAVIVFIVHQNDPFAKQELPLIYLASYLMILIMGGGKYSVDYFLSKKKGRR